MALAQYFELFTKGLNLDSQDVQDETRLNLENLENPGSDKKTKIR